MSTSKSYIQSLYDYFSDKNLVYKPMFGEYGIYYNKVFIGVICDEKIYLKNCKSTAVLQNRYHLISPYPGAKPHYCILDDDIDNKNDLLTLCDKMSFELQKVVYKKQ